MGLTSDVAGEFDKGILLFFQIIRWAAVIFVGCLIAFGLWWILNKIGFFNMFIKKKIKKKGKKK